MATMKVKHPSRGNPVRCSLVGEVYFRVITFEFAGSTNDPDTVNPSDGVTLAHSDTGVYTCTFDAHTKPKAVLWGNANVAELDADIRVEVGEYVPSTGVLTIYAHKDDAVSGIPAAANMADGDTCKMLLLCSDSQLADLQG